MLKLKFKNWLSVQLAVISYGAAIRPEVIEIHERMMCGAGFTASSTDAYTIIDDTTGHVYKTGAKVGGTLHVRLYITKHVPLDIFNRAERAIIHQGIHTVIGVRDQEQELKAQARRDTLFNKTFRDKK